MISRPTLTDLALYPLLFAAEIAMALICCALIVLVLFQEGKFKP